MQTGTLDRQYVSSINFMDQREILNKVLDIWDEESDIADIMRMTDRYVPTAQEEYHYHVNTRLHSAGVVAGITAEPAVGANSTITLTAGSIKPRVNDLMMTAGGYRAFVYAVSGNDVTVKPVDSSLIAHEAFVATDEVTFFSNGYGEGTGVNAGYVWPTIQYSNNIQIIKGDFKVTDLQAMTTVEVEFEGKPYYFIKGQNDAFKRFKMDVAHALLSGQKSSSDLTDVDGNRIWLTHGLEPSVQSSGINLQLRVDTFANFETDFKAFNRALDRAKGPSEYWLWNGPDINNQFDDWLADKTPSGAVTYASFNGIGSKERAIQFGFESFKIYGRTFHKKAMPILDNPEVTAAKDFNGPSKMFMIPGNKVKTQYDAESKDRFRVRYMEAPAGQGVNVTRSNEYYEILTGGLAPVPTDKTMNLSVSYTTWQGAEFLGLEHFATTT